VTPGQRPWVQRTPDGFLARLPGARNVPTPAYHRGRVYTGGYGTYDLHAIHAKTGRPTWSVHLSDDGPTDPACKEGICVFNTYSCTIFGIDAEKGSHLWSWYLGSPQLATPVIAGDVVYTSYPGYGGPSGARYVLGAFELKTGKPLWQRWMDAEVNSTPVAHRGRIYVATRAGSLYELSAKDGDIVSVRRNQIASPPVFVAERVLFGRGELPRDNDMLATSKAIFPELEPVAGPPVGEVRPRPRPLIAQHRLISVDRGVVVATHRTTGRRLWQHHFGDEQPAEVSAPLLQAGSSLLLATSGGNVLRIEPDTGDVLGVYHLGAGQIASQPIAVDGWIYAGTTGGSVVAFDTGDGELTGWEMLGGGPDRRGTLDPEDT
jgi:outer membrane protein assembly factor BamB